jgi:hypothetical protein
MKPRQCIFILLFFWGLLALGACKLDAIFYAISQEPALRDPQISGSPTNIVPWTDGSDTYAVAANVNNVYRYRSGNWETLPHPEGWIRGLAATSTSLFVLTDGTLKKYESGAWTPISPHAGYPRVLTIYVDPGSSWLFAGAGNGTATASSADYAILYLDSAGILQALKSGAAILTGAAFDGTDHFLSTAGSGVFSIAESALSSPSPSLTGPLSGAEGNISGIIAFTYSGSPEIVAIRRDGAVLRYNSGSFTPRGNIGYDATGSLAAWRAQPSDTDPLLLLAGIQGSTSQTNQTNTNGYREIELSSLASGDLTIHAPGSGNISSVLNADKYNSSLGKYPIHYLYQGPAGEQVVFAATVNQGLWSYRDHGDGEEIWNVE